MGHAPPRERQRRSTRPRPPLPWGPWIAGAGTGVAWAGAPASWQAWSALGACVGTVPLYVASWRNWRRRCAALPAARKQALIDTALERYVLALEREGLAPDWEAYARERIRIEDSPDPSPDPAGIPRGRPPRPPPRPRDAGRSARPLPRGLQQILKAPAPRPLSDQQRGQVQKLLRAKYGKRRVEMGRYFGFVAERPGGPYTYECVRCGRSFGRHAKLGRREVAVCGACRGETPAVLGDGAPEVVLDTSAAREKMLRSKCASCGHERGVHHLFSAPRSGYELSPGQRQRMCAFSDCRCEGFVERDGWASSGGTEIVEG